MHAHGVLVGRVRSSPSPRHSGVQLTVCIRALGGEGLARMKVLLNQGAEVKMAASVDRERFGQERLEHYYKKMTKKLSPWKHVILFVQHVLTWKKTPFSLLLFAVVHWVF